jgi:hypothetical protein
MQCSAGATWWDAGAYAGPVTQHEPGTGWSSDPAEMVEQVKAMAGEMSVEDLRAFTMSLLTAGSAHADSFSRPEPPNQRRPRRDDVRTYRVRVDIVGAKPPIWRRLDLGSDLMLDDLHVAIQAAFGWTDSHLHRFGVGPSFWDHSTEWYLCPFDVEEGEDHGVPEHEVRLDEVLVEAGDTLLYVYDYGDDWEHRVRLEEVSDRAEGAPLAVCVDGRRAGPPEDCGGIPGYEQMLAEASDPTAEMHAEAVEHLGFFVEEGDFDPSRFDRDDVNAALEGALDHGLRAAYHTVKLGGLLLSVQGRPSGEAMLDLVRKAALDRTTLVDITVARQMTQRFAWMLDRVGDDGIRLTAAGYLPPVHVEAAMTELGLDEEWIGKGNREDLTYPVLDLRETTQRLGLLRKYRGRLLLTKLGQRVRDDPVALWWHIARRLPSHKHGSSEFEAGVVALLLAAAGRELESADSLRLVADVLTDLGWRLSTGEPISPDSARDAASDTLSILEHTGAVEKESLLARSSKPTPNGRVLARAALSASG